jgi:hypothetical protein
MPEDQLGLAPRLRGHADLNWEEWTQYYTERADQVPPDAERVWLKRVKASHHGIGERRSIRHLIATAVDQPFLDEIAMLEGLERLDLEWPFTASDLSGLRNLRHLAHIGINSPRNVTDFTPLLDLPSLRRLFVENARHLREVEWLADAHHLASIGVEGSIWTMQPIASLRPFAGLRSLQGLFLTSVKLADKDLSPLADCPSLRVLQCARFAPRAEFERLQRLRPDLDCSWFDPASWA